MDKGQKAELVRLARKAVQFNCPMAPYTTLGVGGNADALYEAGNEQDLRRLIIFLNEERIPYVPVGGGSNLLVKDSGISGLVILLRGSLALAGLDKRGGLTVTAGAGLSIADLLMYCRGLGLGGLEFLAGIPGTVGGAVAENAGAFGTEVETRVKEIVMITDKGKLISKKRTQLTFSYRTLEIEKGAVIIRADLNTQPASKKEVASRIAKNLKWRKEHQPLEYASAGSVFKNPPEGYAGELIEKVGLKGMRIGGAMFSKKHANFIVNTGNAKAEDVLGLINLAQEKVKIETGVELAPEIRVIGG